jgi:glucose-6-phosphate isomerase
MQSIVNKLQQLVHQVNSNEICLFDQTINFTDIKNFASQIQNRCRALVIIGFGASSLNIQALLSSVDQPFIDVFFIDNTDSYLIDSIFKKIDLKSTAFFAISLSGETDEVICLLNILNIPAQNLYIVTKLGSTLFNFAKQRQANYIEYPSNFNIGRCALFNPVFLSIAEIVGADAQKLFHSATQAISDHDIHKQVIQETTWMLQNYAHHRPNIVIISYTPKLQGLIKWLNQLIAESLGKAGFGFMPYSLFGTSYEHSLLQLFLDGPDDKLYKIFYQNSKVNSLDKLLTNHGHRALDHLTNLNKPVNSDLINSVNEALIANLVIKYILIVGLIGKIKQINPFNQPAVEKLKSSLKK